MIQGSLSGLYRDGVDAGTQLVGDVVLGLGEGLSALPLL